MADQKISQLNNIAGANVAADDEFVIVDTDANETKAIRADNIRAAVGLATTDSPTFAGLTVDSAGTATISTDAAAGTNQAEFALMKGGIKRFVLAATDEAEAAGNVGSNFEIEVWGNAGFYQSSPFKIRRSDRRVILGDVDVNVLTSAGTIKVDSSSLGVVEIDSGGSGYASYFQLLSAGSTRWLFSKSSTPETGANAGSDFVVNRYTDGGVFIDQPLIINRASGAVTIPNNLGIGSTSPSAKLDVVGDAEINGNTICTGYVKTQATTVASLTAAATAGAGARSFVTDATATTFASVVAGGGANAVPVYSDGTDWRIG